MKPAILAIDNDQIVLVTLKMFFQDRGIEIQTATSGSQGVALFRENPRQYSIVLLDYEMKVNDTGLNGDEVARQLKAINNDVRIIIVSGRETPEIVRACSEAGAEQFIVKNTEPEKLVNTIRSMLLLEECDEKENESERGAKISRILKMVGRSPELGKVAELVSRFATFDEPALILGESGVGKEAVAKAIHENSHRKTKPFVAVNCAAFSKELLESELFGHERGAFTGALTKKLGLFEQATGGSVFLDEIGDMPIILQAKILRALQEKTIQPVGGTPRKVDFRIIAATHRDLKKAAQQGEFREDLYFRLNYLKIEIPPLRERPEDIEPLIRHFLFQMQKKTGVIKVMESAVMRKLKSYKWPGNVRDLEAVVAKIYVLSDERISSDILPAEISSTALDQLASLKEYGDVMSYKEFNRLSEDAERLLLARAMERANGIKSLAANILGMSHSTMNHRRVLLGLDKPAARSAPDNVSV